MNQRLSQILFFSFLIVSQANFGVIIIPYSASDISYHKNKVSSLMKALYEKHAQIIDGYAKSHNYEIAQIQTEEEKKLKKAKEIAEIKRKYSCKELELKLQELIALQKVYAQSPCTIFMTNINGSIYYTTEFTSKAVKIKLKYLKADEFVLGYNNGETRADSVLEGLEAKLTQDWFQFKCSVND